MKSWKITALFLCFCLLLGSVSLAASAESESFDVTVDYDTGALGYGVLPVQVVGEITEDGGISIKNIYAMGEDVSYMLTPEIASGLAALLPAAGVGVPSESEEFDVTVDYDTGALGYGVLPVQVVGTVSGGSVSIKNIYAMGEDVSYMLTDEISTGLLELLKEAGIGGAAASVKIDNPLAGMGILTSGGSSVYPEGTAATDLESKIYTDVVFPDATEGSQAGVRAGKGVTATIENSRVTKSAGDLMGDDASFYGVNSGIHSYEDAHLTITGTNVYTNGVGANGVFAYGDSVICISDSVVETDSYYSGGIMAAGGGKLYAEDLYVTTEGGSSAAIRSDRGGGLMVVDGGTYISNGSLGTGSPAVYCVADITVSNATLVAKSAQAFCFEGRNPGKVYNCYLEGNYSGSDDDETSNVMVYQSNSGDAEEGTSYFTMVGGVLKAVNSKELQNYKMFYTTNTYCYISLYDVEILYPEVYKEFLLCACNENIRTWGTAGANGSVCVLYCIDQDIKGAIEYDTWSYLDCYFTDNSVAETVFLMREDNGERGCSVYLDASSQIILTGDSVVQNLYTGGSVIVDEEGVMVSIVGTDGTVYVQGASALTMTVTGVYSEEDLSAQENVANIGTESNYSFNPAAIAAEYVDVSYIPVDEEGNVYTEAHSFT